MNPFNSLKSCDSRNGFTPHLCDDQQLCRSCQIKFSKDAGFSLIEVLVISTITIFLTIVLLSNVLRSRINIPGAARIFITDLRLAQANALASKQFNGTYRCGYGLHKLTTAESGDRVPPLVPNSAYFIFVGRQPQSGGCSAGDEQYNGTDQPIFLTRVIDSRLELLSPTTGNDPRFDDIYFKAPDGQVFINGQHDPNQINPPRRNKAQVIIRKIGASCPSFNCIYVCIYASGKIETRNNNCPAI